MSIEKTRCNLLITTPVIDDTTHIIYLRRPQTIQATPGEPPLPFTYDVGALAVSVLIMCASISVGATDASISVTPSLPRRTVRGGYIVGLPQLIFKDLG